MAAVALAHTATGAASAAPPLLILHGLFGSGRNWGGVARRLGAARRVLSLDLRNHGASPWAATMSYEEMAADCLALMDTEGFEAADLMGHSMGGKAAMTLALLHPARVARLVAVDIAPVAYRSVNSDYAEAMRDLDLGAVASRGDAEAALAPRIPDPAERAFLLQNLVRGAEGYAWRVNLPAILEAIDDIAGFPETLAGRRYDGPALFVAGGRSRYLRPEHEETVDVLFPRASVVRIADAGHWVHVDRPDAFVDKVTAFLDNRD